MDKYEEYHMTPVPKTDPFPYTEVKTERGADADRDELADDLLNWFAWNYVNPTKWSWVFRGTRKHDYQLDSSLDRRLNGTTEFSRQNAEDYLLSQFKKAARHFPETLMVQDEDKLEWLALMQHYGTPTRLLDFTRSPYVACFFALEELHTDAAGQEKENGAIWAVDTAWLIRNSLRCLHESSDTLPEFTEDGLVNGGVLSQNFNRLFVCNPWHLVLPIGPSRSNPRLLAQQGLFLCPSIAEAGFRKNLASYRDYTQDMADHVFKIIVEARTRINLLSELHLMNISRATLFPGLPGYAKSLAHEVEFRSADEIRRFR